MVTTLYFCWPRLCPIVSCYVIERRPGNTVSKLGAWLSLRKSGSCAEEIRVSRIWYGQPAEISELEQRDKSFLLLVDSGLHPWVYSIAGCVHFHELPQNLKMKIMSILFIIMWQTYFTKCFFLVRELCRQNEIEDQEVFSKLWIFESIPN